MNNYLAKSNPKETIVEHTEKLINNYQLFKKIYPDLNIDWDILYLSCLYHDLGKINRKFQDKIEKSRIHSDEIPHGILSLAFINARDLETQGFTKDKIKLLTHSIAYHHDRDFKFEKKILKDEIDLLKSEVINFKYGRLENIEVKKISAKYFSMDRIYEEDNILFFNYIKIKGLLNRIDYAASAGIRVETKNDFLLRDLNLNLLNNLKSEKNPNPSWNKLQNYMIENQDENVIVTAQTGMGKTEAGLLWIGDNKGFFTLPLKTAINAIYKRITEKIVLIDYENKVGLLHSDINKEYFSKKDEIDFDEYFNKTKQLSLPLTVCTLDQIFDFVYRYRGFELKLATLSYSKVVIDEVQMYSPDLLAYLIVGLSYIEKIGGKFAVLTATLPKIFVELLEKEDVNFKLPKPFTNNKIRHSVKVLNEKLNTKFIKSIYKENKILVICNTVKKAQDVYELLLGDQTIKDEIRLFHSGFIKKDRREIEDRILKFGNKENIEKGIWITTQVVEASLDIDFDILVTELSDLNGLFQRMGRCYRSREWNKEGYNCYVFDGGDSKCSGVGKVIDEKIFSLSKEALKDIDGIITEDNKISLIDSIYTTDILKGTDYHEKLIDAIKYVKLIESYEKSASEIKKIFRNIESKTVIPRPVYDYYKSTIDSYIEILRKKYDKEMTDDTRNKLKEEKLYARINLDDFTVSTPSYRADKKHLSTIRINDYEDVKVLECDYNEKIGIRYKSVRNDEKEVKCVEDRML